MPISSVFKGMLKLVEKNTMTVDFKAYSDAKKSLPELKKLLTAVDECVTILNPYQKYVIVFNVIDKLLDLKIILNSYTIKATQIVVTKGKK